jgi:hypothetical protein
MPDLQQRIETEEEVQSYIEKLRYALSHGAEISFQQDRRVDQERDERYTNRFTVSDLFPDENPADVLREELKTLHAGEYIHTVKDHRFPKRSDMRVFGRRYHGADDVYIKIRVELLSAAGNHTTFVMSFHYAMMPFSEEQFPYRK